MDRISFSWVFLFSFMGVISVSAQNARIDSMKRLLPTTTGGVERSDLLRGLAAEYFKVDKNITLQYLDEIINLIPDIQDNFRIARAYRSKSHLLFYLGRYREVISSLSEGLSFARRNKIDDEMTIMLNIAGAAYTYIGEYEKALKCLLEGITLRQLSSNGIDLDLLYNNLGLVYYKLRNNERALEYYQKALEVSQGGKSWTYPGILYINIGLCYCELGYYDEAVNYINQGLSKCIKKCDDVIVAGQFALGMTKSRMGDFASSEFHLDSSLMVSRNINDTRYITENLVYLARVYIQADRYNFAGQALRESENMALQHGYNEILLNIYKGFIDLFQQTKDYFSLSEYYYKHARLREKMYGQALLQSVAAFQADLEHRENTRTLVRQNQIMVLRNDALSRQRELYYGLAFIIMLLGVIVILVCWRIFDKRKVNRLLAKRIEERSLELKKKQVELEQAREELGELIKPVFKGIPDYLAFLLEIDPRGISDSTTAAQYTKAVRNTVETIRRLVTAARELTWGKDL